jgi:copper(I)-binding protein
MLFGAPVGVLAGDLQTIEPEVVLPIIDDDPAEAYFAIRNTGQSERRIVGASSPKADRVEIRRTRFEGGQETASVVDEWPLPRGSVTIFSEGGVFLALVGAGDLAPGSVVPIDLQLDGGEKLSLEAVVQDD